MEKQKIIAQNKNHLEVLIKQEINIHGNNCDLNFIDTSLITEFNFLFKDSFFCGDISKWDVSNVVGMEMTFCESQFNGDLSKWCPLSLENIDSIFFKSSLVNIPFWADRDKLKE